MSILCFITSDSISPQLLHSGIRMHSVEIILLDSNFAEYNKQTVVIKSSNNRNTKRNTEHCYDI